MKKLQSLWSRPFLPQRGPLSAHRQQLPARRPQPRAPALTRLEAERARGEHPSLSSSPFPPPSPGHSCGPAELCAPGGPTARSPLPGAASPGPTRGTASPGRKPDEIGFWPFVFQSRGRRPPAPRSRTALSRPTRSAPAAPQPRGPARSPPRPCRRREGRQRPAAARRPPARGEACSGRSVPVHRARAAAAHGSAEPRHPPARPAPPPCAAFRRGRPAAAHPAPGPARAAPLRRCGRRGGWSRAARRSGVAAPRGSERRCPSRRGGTGHGGHGAGRPWSAKRTRCRRPPCRPPRRAESSRSRGRAAGGRRRPSSGPVRERGLRRGRRGCGRNGARAVGRIAAGCRHLEARGRRRRSRGPARVGEGAEAPGSSRAVSAPAAALPPPPARR